LRECDFILVGQGIAGSVLYHSLSKAGEECVVIDEKKPNSASRVAAGLINPVTGRRLVKSWMIDDLIPAFKKVYYEIENDFNIKVLFEKQLTWHLPATDIVEAFEKRLYTTTDFLAQANSEESRAYFNFPFKAGNVQPCFIVDVQLILDSIRNDVASKSRLLDEQFDHQQLEIDNNFVQFKNLRASKIIFCEGNAATSNPWFASLPYSLNKGEALILSIEGLPRTHIYKFKQTLVPLPGGKDLWWYGSNYIWEFENDQPTSRYREASEKELLSWLKLPFKIVDHKAAIRYATVERRPFIGFHPAQPNIGIFNGWGTKGCSLVPYFAEQFANAIAKGTPINPEVDVRRFAKVLLKA